MTTALNNLSSILHTGLKLGQATHSHTTSMASTRPWTNSATSSSLRHRTCAAEEAGVERADDGGGRLAELELFQKRHVEETRHIDGAADDVLAELGDENHPCPPAVDGRWASFTVAALNLRDTEKQPHCFEKKM